MAPSRGKRPVLKSLPDGFAEFVNRFRWYLWGGVCQGVGQFQTRTKRAQSNLVVPVLGGEGLHQADTEALGDHGVTGVRGMIGRYVAGFYAGFLVDLLFLLPGERSGGQGF